MERLAKAERSLRAAETTYEAAVDVLFPPGTKVVCNHGRYPFVAIVLGALSGFYRGEVNVRNVKTGKTRHVHVDRMQIVDDEPEGEPQCACGHVRDEHDGNECGVDGCDCVHFERDH